LELRLVVDFENRWAFGFITSLFDVRGSAFDILFIEEVEKVETFAFGSLG